MAAVNMNGSQFLPDAKRCGIPAFSLIEVALALGIFSFAVVAILGTISVALDSTRDSEMRLRAAHAGSAIIGTVKANPSFGANASSSNFPLPDLETVGENEEQSGLYVDRQGRAVPSPDLAEFQLGWRLTRDEEMPQLVYCYLELKWPARSTAANASGIHRMASTILLSP
jgi:uncharacterized protein (TIGR02598 family)